ncbi:uncharacterized protein LOC110457077 [Mizuhopecten yessoensis]|uniref:uncharacterized protein LOC110457077 n=1 Tax=Mizuhopecten yessoensis TaxID=6573 RepID=UPI000B457F30|nr:uncharacterized protein LOC110457077 [Mizuhopecten yessoensis]
MASSVKVNDEGREPPGNPSPSKESKKDSKTKTSRPLKAVYCLQFSTKIPFDFHHGMSEVQKMVTLPNDSVVALDRANRKLKLFSADLEFLHYADVGVAPAGLTVIKNSTVAVSSGDMKNHITLFKVDDNTLQRTKDIEWEHENYAVCDITYADHHFVCLTSKYQSTGKSEICVERIDTDGKRRTVFTENGNAHLGYNLISGSGNYFYICDCYKNKVRCMSYEGKLLWETETSRGPLGIALVKENILVSSFAEGVVSQISLDGHMYKSPVIQELAKPGSICYQRKRKRLLVSRSDTGNPIRVYTID